LILSSMNHHRMPKRMGIRFRRSQLTLAYGNFPWLTAGATNGEVT
jgi:hypothetical protein